MPRPYRSPEGKAVRLTIYVDPSTKQALVDYAHRTRQSTGEVISKIVPRLIHDHHIAQTIDAKTPTLNIQDLGPKVAPALPTIAGQPGAEHRAVATKDGDVATARNPATSVAYAGAPSIQGEFYDHPGWKLSATGQNVCTRCGKTKIRSKNATCIPPA